MSRWWLLTFGLALGVANADTSFEEAAQSAKDVSIPVFEAFVTRETVDQTLPATSFGDTKPLSDLRGEDGMGEIREPGLEKAIACDTRTDPECLAIQMLRYGAANRPTFDDETVAAIREGLGDVYEHTDSLLGDLADIGTMERVCEQVETIVPGRSTTEVCDIRTAIATNGTCEEGWIEQTTEHVQYRCTQKAAQVENACTVTTQAITHEEDRYQCIDREAVMEDRTCTVPVTVDVTKTYPYTCPITRAAETKKTCVKTLDAHTTTPCASGTNQVDTLSLQIYIDELGWTGGRYKNLTVTYSCDDQPVFTFKLGQGSRVVASTTLTTSSYFAGDLGSVQLSYGKINGSSATFVVSLKQAWYYRDEVNGWDNGIQIMVTNIDNGTGTVTLTSDVYTFNPKEVVWLELWNETCEVQP